ncbi:MAG: tRNA uridine-5-carboxymethylaminomethyl(34) synthesis GTPase MnmE [Magnetococcus sp. MYC-9]
MHVPLVLETDLIAGLATPPGHSGVAVIRLSGPNLPHALLPLFRHPQGTSLAAHSFKPRQLHLLDLMDPEDSQLLDQALVVYFPAPHSFTGEAQMEIQCHGAPVVIARLLTVLSTMGVRMAKPGEFSRRAYQNGKLALSQAEAMMALIHASSLRAAREAARQLQGSLARVVCDIQEALLQLLVQVEVDLDFSDQDLETEEESRLQQGLRQVCQRLSPLQRGAMLGQQWQNGLDLVIAGQPNVGKSTLYNRLLGCEKAIVTEIPGTTRDLLENRLEIQGLPVLLVDTAGLRTTAEIIEQEGIRRAKARISQADGLLLIYDIRDGLGPLEQQWAKELGSERVILVANKLDLLSGRSIESLPPSMADYASLSVSCQTGEGIEQLQETIYKRLAATSAAEEGSMILVARQRQVIEETLLHVVEAQTLLQRAAPWEILAVELRAALHAWADMAGETSHDTLLDRIFAQFCIGK